jgi:hypothetical protein
MKMIQKSEKTKFQFVIHLILLYIMRLVFFLLTIYKTPEIPQMAGRLNIKEYSATIRDSSIRQKGSKTGLGQSDSPGQYPG